jgi:hypothetical protein
MILQFLHFHAAATLLEAEIEMCFFFRRSTLEQQLALAIGEIALESAIAVS